MDKDVSHQNAIHVETIRKELRHQRLHTEFSINPYRKSDFIEAFHKARQEPTKKYAMPVTESQEIGWLSTPLNPSHRKDERLNFYRRKTDVTKFHEFAQRSSN
ncbi:hypothetical protein INR49_024009 [Caranx melampygus]|nr:hypothetical protein INR49_024009 [Caranx melampygus]